MSKRIVVKVGTSTLTYPTGKLNLSRIERLARELSDLVNAGNEVCLVTSGAQGAGIGRLGLDSKPNGVPERQAVAAIGQGLLMHIYEKMFSEYGKLVAQVLLTREDLMDRRRYLNARNSLGSLFGFGAIPIINENDTVATDEICFGDNDTLSALVSSLVDADILIILTDTGGLYTANPKLCPQATLIPIVTDISARIESLAGCAGSALGTGGMQTKIQAAKIAIASGVTMVIAPGYELDVVRRVVSGEMLGTTFTPRASRPVSRKRWAVFGRMIMGTLTVDEGAVSAITDKGCSLLPRGITGLDGDFELGAVLAIMRPDGHEFARGVSNYTSFEIRNIIGASTKEIEPRLGYTRGDEVVHRDNLICL